MQNNANSIISSAMRMHGTKTFTVMYWLTLLVTVTVAADWTMDKETVICQF